MEVSKTPKKKEDTTMKRKKFLALALAGVMTAVTLTACAPLEVLYDWFFGGGGSSSASRGNGTGLVESKTLEENIIQWFGLSSATRKKDVAEPMLQEVAKSFDPESWYNDRGELNDTAKDALDAIVKDKLTANRPSKYTFVDVWEVKPSQMDATPSPDRQLYEDSFFSSGGGPNSDVPTHSSNMSYSYAVEKRWMESYIPYINTFDVYAGVFQKNGKTYAAMVIIW